jgi:hypothetical protein
MERCRAAGGQPVTLRTALIIDGNAQGAVKATTDTSRALTTVGNEARAAGGWLRGVTDNVRPLSPAADRGTGSLGSLRMMFKSAAREAAVLGGPLAGLIGQTGALVIGSGRLGLATTGVVITVAALGLAAYKSVSALHDLETQQAKVTAGLILTRGAAGLTAVGFEDMARRAAASGTQSVDDIRAAQVELQKFRLSGTAIGAAIDVAKGVAAAGFADLKTGASAVAKALKEPAAAAEILAEVGLKLSVAEQRVAADLDAAGRRAEAQRVILDVLAKQTAGADAAAADTLGAAWGRMTAAGGRVLEQWGQTIDRAVGLRGALDSIARAADSAANGGRAPLRITVYGGRGSGESEAERQSRERIAKVNDALLLQARTAGMTAIQQEVYNRAVEAGVNADSDAAKAAGGLTEAQKKAADAIRGKVNAIHALDELRDVTANIRGQTAAAEAEAGAVGRSAGAAAAYTTVQEALAAARIKGIVLSKAQAAAIEAEGAAFGRAKDAAAQAKLANDLFFERAQLGRGEIDASIAARLRGAGLPVDLNSTAAGIIRVNEQMRITKDIATDLVGGTLKEVRAEIAGGTNAWEAFQKAGLNAIGRVADKLIDIATQNLIAKAFGGTFLGSLFGGGSASAPLNIVGANGPLPTPTFHGGGIVGRDRASGVRYIHPAYFDNAPRFHAGRPPWGPGERGAILRDDEGVFTQAQMRALGRGGAQRPVINIYPVPGSTMDVRENADGSLDIVGRLIDDKLKAFDKALPTRVAAINADPRRR